MKTFRFLFIALAVMLCINASAYSFEVDGIYYSVTSSSSSVSHVKVTYGDNKYYGDVVIPEKVIYNDKEYSVTSIGASAFSDCGNVTNVTIPNSVTAIGESAFRGCSGITSVTIPNSITAIGESAFRECYGLTSVTIPNSVRWIRDYTFAYCHHLTSVTIPNSVTSIGYRAFYLCSDLTAVHITDLSAWCKIEFDTDWDDSNPTTYAHHLYLNGEEITNLVIPDDVTSIGNLAFYGCSGLTSVTIPNSVTYIGRKAFENCSGLTAVHITDLSAWCKTTFDGDTSNPTYYTHHLYLNGEEITNLVIPDDIPRIGNYAFYGCSGITSVTIPNSVTSIGMSVFYDCKSLTSVTIPNSVTSIGDYAFWNCSGLTSVTIPNSVTRIGNGVFCKCTGLTSVTIPNSVTSIGRIAFSSCSGLTSVTIPNFVTNIGDFAFSDCSGLTAVHITDLSAWCKINFVTGESNPTYYAHHLYLNGEDITNLVIPDDVTSIGDYAFWNCSGLTSVTIPNSVTGIGDYAFYENKRIRRIDCMSETPPAVYANTFSSSIYTWATLNVPEGCADKYKAANIWKEFTNMTAGGVVPEEPKQCAAPVITYADGKLQFACETEGAEYRYTLTDTDIKSVYTDVWNSAVNLSACYTIMAYAYAEGYTNSEKVTATLYWVDGNIISTNINQTEMRGVMATCSGGIITVSGLSDGETVIFYDANGALLYTGTAQNGTISYAPSTSGVIMVKIGTASIKVVNE